MDGIELHRRYPLSIVNVTADPKTDPPPQLVMLGYSFVPKSVDEKDECVLQMSGDGSSASLITHSARDTQPLATPSTSDEEVATAQVEHRLTGTTTMPNKIDCVLRVVSSGSCQLLPVCSVTGLKRERGELFSRVSDSVAKAARTSLREKQRQPQGQVPSKRKKPSAAPSDGSEIGSRTSVSIDAKPSSPPTVATSSETSEAKGTISH
mmetsp:Transcript_2794/g.5081  ORF Transcript_2794/g.5081 Transcript_2794/m.5081 type:complete len:208 (+) Transcript_2794:202-825(+)